MLRSTRAPRRAGAVLMKVAICLPVLLGVLALNLDGGRLYDERRRSQATADAAALAAGADLYANYWTNQGADPAGAARAAAEQVAVANGYPASAVTVSIPPTSGAYAGQPGHAEVRIDTTLAATFGRAITGDAMGVAARAVARGEPAKIGIVLLNPSASGAFKNTAAAFALINKPLVVNSTSPTAIQSSGLLVLSLSKVYATGGVAVSSLLPVGVPVRTGVRPTPDPFALLPVPDEGAAPVRSSVPLTISSAVPTVLQPGVYKGGIRVTGLGVVVMLPGVYIMQGGGFRVDGAGTVTGLGTMVYNTTSPTYAPGPISVTGLGKVVMTAPTSGTYQGMSFFQHRGLAQPVTVSGAGLTTITGTVYAAKAAVALTGNAAVGLDVMGGAFVADSMTVGGVGAVTVSLGLNPPRVPDVRVVE
ncbi:pilus assembly protein TadG-related protein [Gemmata sp. JC717]|uniref:pilus assembly protein TadG-related protein n=1 Tax=Gemmata algarum TaxID=2975278 RepID=UPI0021BA5B99|nr:pilus assembly protein TadG-related protein [Gemmata algarum]MDY3554903.1 pilus assembly protein TadG-related protein [Gemmata algarum]